MKIGCNKSKRKIDYEIETDVCLFHTVLQCLNLISYIHYISNNASMPREQRYETTLYYLDNVIRLKQSRPVFKLVK